MNDLKRLQAACSEVKADWNGKNWRVFAVIQGIPFASYNKSLRKAAAAVAAVLDGL